MCYLELQNITVGWGIAFDLSASFDALQFYEPTCFEPAVFEPFHFRDYCRRSHRDRRRELGLFRWDLADHFWRQTHATISRRYVGWYYDRAEPSVSFIFLFYLSLDALTFVWNADDVKGERRAREGREKEGERGRKREKEEERHLVLVCSCSALSLSILTYRPWTILVVMSVRRRYKKMEFKESLNL